YYSYFCYLTQIPKPTFLVCDTDELKTSTVSRFLVLTNASLMSAIKSSASSLPHDKRMSESATPDCNLFSRGIDLCVICAGWQMRLFTPPRLSASLKYWVEVTNATAASSVSSFSEKEITPPYKPFC